MPVYTLSIYQHYACRHSGACCNAGWAIPVEPELLPVLHVDLLVPNADGACGHFDRVSRLCRVQRDHGEETLPRSCFQFPRRALIDERGTFVTLSNFCPTAAKSLCESEEPLAIVEQPPAFPASRVYEGLDARGHWPPLVRPGLLFDLNSFDRWERFVVHMLAGPQPVHEVLGRIAFAAELLRGWEPERGSFGEWTTKTLRKAMETTPSPPDELTRYRPFSTPAAYERLRSFVPSSLVAREPMPDPPSTSTEPSADIHARTVRRYLAAKAFGSWAAYEASGVRTLVAELIVSALVLRIECERVCRSAARPLDGDLMCEAVRQSDRLLIHLIERPRMIAWLGSVEGA